MIYCLIPTLSFTQVIDNTASFRDIKSGNYIRFHYDNDFFTATDYYYTQGINIEYVHPSLIKNPVSKILVRFKDDHIKYGMAVEHIAFTPTSIRHNEILSHDRPFAAFVLLKSFSSSVDTSHRQRITAAFSIGIIGQAAFGEGMQKTIHHWLKNIEPLGWQNQIHNDVIVNYELNHEKQIYSSDHFVSLNSNLMIEAGTLVDEMSAGFTVTAGKYTPPFSGAEKKDGNNFQLYFYNQPLLRFNGYDATLQGGMLNHASPYTLSADEITRITFRDNFGIILTTGKLYLEYYQSFLTKEFNSGRTHRWGGIKIGLAF